MSDQIKQEIKLQLDSIEIECQDEDNGVEILETNLNKAEELRMVLGKAFEDATNLCSSIEIWIDEAAGE